MTQQTNHKFSPEVRKRAVRMVFDHQTGTARSGPYACRSRARSWVHLRDSNGSRNADAQPVRAVDNRALAPAYCARQRRAPSGRAVRGSVFPRKMACRPVAGLSLDCGSRPSTRARGQPGCCPLSLGPWFAINAPLTLPPRTTRCSGVAVGHLSPAQPRGFGQ